MRNGQNKRMRGRNNNNNNGKSSNPLTRVYESNGPDVKIRGTASHVAEKYIQLARDSQASGDPVAAENYYQHAEHYFRMIAAAQEQFRQSQQQPFNRPEGDSDQRTKALTATTTISRTQGEPGYGNREPQTPYPPRDNQFQPREQQHYQNRDSSSRSTIASNSSPIRRATSSRRSRSRAAVTVKAMSAACRPSSPAARRRRKQRRTANAQNGHEGQADRYPLHRRRRRHRGPRTDVPGGIAASTDGNQSTPRPTND